MLYGMSVIYGYTGSTLLAEIAPRIGELASSTPLITLGIVFVLIGFAFKVSAVPFHTWAPDTYEGAPTPVTAFLAVASKAAGFVALLTLIFVGFWGRHDVWEPLMWVLATITDVRRQPHRPAPDQRGADARLLGIAQAGYMLAPLAVAGTSPEAASQALHSVVIYLVIYAAMNLGAFAVRPRRGPQDPLGRARLLRRPVRLRPGPHRGHVDLPLLARRHPAGGRVVRQDRHLPGPGLGRHHVGLRARRDRRRRLGDRVRLLRRRSPR